MITIIFIEILFLLILEFYLMVSISITTSKKSYYKIMVTRIVINKMTTNIFTLLNLKYYDHTIVIES